MVFAVQPLIGLPALTGSVEISASVAAPVRFELRQGLGVATMIARKGATPALIERIRELLDVELPQGPRRAGTAEIAFIGTGPGTWLVTCEVEGSSLATQLKERVGPLASISDQSDAYPVLRLSGARGRDVLAKLVSLDLHPAVFNIGHSASTGAAHISVILWRLENAPDGSSAFEIAFPRSMAGSLWHAIQEAAAEYR
jgi:heterotetrameric sarcosine oxidase gamma subunit